MSANAIIVDCSYPPSTSSYTYYPFYVVANSCGSLSPCPKIIQLKETRSTNLIGSGPGNTFFCGVGNTQYKYNWQSSFLYTDNSRSFAFPTNSAHDNFVTASGNVTAPVASATKIWGVSNASTGSELGTYVNTSTWTTGSGGITGLPSPLTNVPLVAALGSHISYGGTSGLVFLSLNSPTLYGKIYAMSYTAAKTDEEEEYIVTSPIEKLENQLKLSPNPASNHVVFDLSTLTSSEFELKIYDQLGREVMIPADYKNIDAGRIKYDVNISDLPNGFYSYRLNADKTYSGSFIKK